MRTKTFCRPCKGRYLAVWIVVLFVLLGGSSVGICEDVSSIDTLRQMGKAFATIAGQASPAVVGLEVEKTISYQQPSIEGWPFGDPFSPFEDDPFDHFFRRRSPRRYEAPKQRPRTDKGSGFIISTDGYILTNNHLAEDADKITVKLGDGRKFEAKVIGTDPESDVAALKIDAEDLSYLELADSDALEVGEWVLAIGNPFGLSHTVTAGIVSAKGRRVGLTSFDDFIQTDAAINPGNSGGPLLNLDGKVVGINTAMVSRSGGNMGIGLAIPINMAKSIYEQLLESGTVTRGYLGVVIQELTDDLAKSFGMEGVKGVLLPDVTEGSAAAEAGIKKGDIVVEFDGEPMEDKDDFRNHVAMLKPGTKVEIVILRDGNRKTLTVELGERPKQFGAAASEKSEALEELGITVQNLTDDLAERLGYEGMSGVVVSGVEPGSLAAAGGIQPGMLIQEVNRQQIKNTKDFYEALEKASEEGTILLYINNGQYSQYIVLKLGRK